MENILENERRFNSMKSTEEEFEPFIKEKHRDSTKTFVNNSFTFDSSNPCLLAMFQEMCESMRIPKLTR